MNLKIFPFISSLNLNYLSFPSDKPKHVIHHLLHKVFQERAERVATHETQIIFFCGDLLSKAFQISSYIKLCWRMTSCNIKDEILQYLVSIRSIQERGVSPLF